MKNFVKYYKTECTVDKETGEIIDINKKSKRRNIKKGSINLDQLHRFQALSPLQQNLFVFYLERSDELGIYRFGKIDKEAFVASKINMRSTKTTSIDSINNAHSNMVKKGFVARYKSRLYMLEPGLILMTLASLKKRLDIFTCLADNDKAVRYIGIMKLEKLKIEKKRKRGKIIDAYVKKKNQTGKINPQ